MRPISHAVLALALALLGALARAEDKPRNAGPYVPSPQSIVSDMLKLANVGPEDFVIDLGSGDGRIVLTAAKVFGARGFGVEIKDELIKLSNDTARAQGLAERVRFIKGDLFKTDVSQATVLTMYLLPDTVNLLRNKLFSELRPGTRIISHDYPLTGWTPVRYVHMDLEDKRPISGVTTTLIYLYEVPERVAGSWQARLPAAFGREAGRLELEQTYSRVTGTLQLGQRSMAVQDGTISGTELKFRATGGGRAWSFVGRLSGGAFTGTATAGSDSAAWSASRVQ